MPICEIDLRPGGAYHFVHRGPEGKDYPFKGVYREIVRPERLVYTQIFDIEPWSTHEALITLTLSEQHGGKTELTSTALYQSVEDRNANLKMGKQKMVETMDRLAEHLTVMNRTVKLA